MKTKLVISLILLLATVSFIFERSSANVKELLRGKSVSDLRVKISDKSESFMKATVKNVTDNAVSPESEEIADKEFFIGVYHSGIDTHYMYYPDLKVNAWHKYTAPTGWGCPDVYSDNYTTAPFVYGPTLIAKINHNRQHGLRSVMDRPKIQYLATGQRSDYQCEEISRGSAYWFYAYDIHEAGADINDFQFNGNGARVRYCETNPTVPGGNAGYVVKNLRANREQANKSASKDWRTDETYEWYVMPRIRIDTSVLRINPDTKVCAIIINNWNGDRIDSVNILARNFIDQDTHYSGNYIEQYYFPDFNKLIIDTSLICPGSPRDFTNWSSADRFNTDFRVYWYGLCDMWIDYVRVENRPAHELFHNYASINWDSDLSAEIDFALTGYDADNPVPNNFYLDEFEFNNIPCIEYINKFIRAHSNGRISLMVPLNYDLLKVHIPPISPELHTEMSAEEINDYLVEKAELGYLITLNYPYLGYAGDEGNPDKHPPKSYHPSTLYSGGYEKEKGILSYPLMVSNYEDSLQDRYEYGGWGQSYIKIMKIADSITKRNNNIKLINAGQTHLWWSPGHKLKEPSNEEINLSTYISICYGAKGIFHFCYDSHDSLTNVTKYSRGLSEEDLRPRISSVYNQNKWEAVRSIFVPAESLPIYFSMSNNLTGRTLR